MAIERKVDELCILLLADAIEALPACSFDGSTQNFF
jgi:hypothetical protein